MSKCAHGVQGLDALPAVGIQPQNTSAAREALARPSLDSLQLLANKGQRLEQFEADLKSLAGQNRSLQSQLAEANSTIDTKSSSIAALTDERDYVSSQRTRERADLEQQLTQAVQKITALRGELKHAEQLQVYPKQARCSGTCMNCSSLWQHTCLSMYALQLQAQEKAKRQAQSPAAPGAHSAPSSQRQLQQLQQELQQNMLDAQQQAKHAAESHSRQAEAQLQQLSSMEAQLAEAVQQAEEHNQRRLQAEQQLLAVVHEQQQAAPTAISESDSILLTNLRDQLAAQSADIAEARRLKAHVR